MNSLLISLALFSSPGQDKPVQIAKADLPKLAECVICNAAGEGHDQERPAAGVTYKGKSYFFCSVKEVSTFNKNPEFYLPLVLPMALPNFDLTDLQGRTWNQQSIKDGVVLLDYWATWCKPCLALKPKLDLILETYKDKGYEMLSVSIDEKRSVLDSFLKKANWGTPVAHDTKQTWASLRVAAIPALFLVKNGKVVAEFRGKIDVQKVERAVRDAVNDLAMQGQSLG